MQLLLLHYIIFNCTEQHNLYQTRQQQQQQLCGNPGKFCNSRRNLISFNTKVGVLHYETAAAAPPTYARLYIHIYIHIYTQSSCVSVSTTAAVSASATVPVRTQKSPPAVTLQVKLKMFLHTFCISVCVPSIPSKVYGIKVCSWRNNCALQCGQLQGIYAFKYTRYLHSLIIILFWPTSHFTRS